MSSPLFSQQEGPSVAELLKENKIKDLALSKASNLIELLNIELEVQRNSSQQALRAMEEELRERYQKQLSELQQKVQVLEHQLKKDNANERTIRSTVTRTNSARSLENKMKRSAVSRKCNDTTPNEQTDKLQLPQVSAQFFRLQMQQLEDWRAATVNELSGLIKGEYDELQKIITRIEEASEDFNSVTSSRQRSSRDVAGELMEIVRAQNRVINSLKAYSQQLETLCKSTQYKLASLLGKKETSVAFQPPQIDESVQQLCLVVSRREHELKAGLASLEGQNCELKNILDSMIRLVKEEKKMR